MNTLMRNFVGASLVLILCFPFSLNAQSLKPLPTEFVDCVTNKVGQPVESRKKQTSVFVSPNGSRAYAVVHAEASHGSCRNSTVVYVAGVDGAFIPVHQQSLETDAQGSVYDGNGVAHISWSPSGSTLLVVISLWTWGTDGGGNYKYVLIDSADHSSKLAFPERYIFKQFSHPCAALIEFDRWLDDQHIVLEARPYTSGEDEGADRTPSCVQQAKMFTFNTVNDTVVPFAQQ